MSKISISSQARVAFLFSLAAYIVSIFHRLSIGPISSDLERAFQISASEIGLIASMYFYIYTITQIPVGILVDNYGPRRILFWGGMLASLGSVFFSISNSFVIVLISRIVIGLGVSVTFISTLKIIAMNYPAAYFGRMSGILQFVGNLGAVFAGAPLVALVQLYDWRMPFIWLGVLSFFIALLSFRWITEIKIERKKSTWRHDVWLVFKTRGILTLCLVNICLTGAFFSFPGLWMSTYLEQIQGIPKSEVGWFISTIFLSFAFGAVLIGDASDRLRKRRLVMQIAIAVTIFAWVAFAFNLIPIGNRVVIFICCVLIGMGAPAFTLSWALAKEICPKHLTGTATSVVNVGAFLGPSVFQPITGWALQHDWNGKMILGIRIYSESDFQNGFYLLGTLVFIATVGSFFVRETHASNIWRGHE